jgi:predicted phage terminase large subunit-like protein
MTVDLAIAQHERADYSVFMIAGVDEQKKIHIKDVIRERIDGREIVDLLIRLQRTYDFQAVGIEEMQVSKAIGPFLREEMHKEQVYLSLVPMKHKGKDKIARARSIQARLRAGTVYCDKRKEWYQTFEDELCRFPRDAHDDQVDCFAYLGLLLDMLIEAPTQQESDEDDYLEEQYLHGSNDLGKSRITGY